MSGSERINEQPKVGPKGAAPKGRRKSKYLHQRLRARAYEKVIFTLFLESFKVTKI
jgi:hypothetical protein